MIAHDDALFRLGLRYAELDAEQRALLVEDLAAKLLKSRDPEILVKALRGVSAYALEVARLLEKETAS